MKESPKNFKKKGARFLGRVTLERALSKLGVVSRSQARSLIKAGRVRSQGKVLNDPLSLVVPERLRVDIDGQSVQNAKWRTLMLNKPRGLVTTRSDEQARPTIYSLIEKEPFLHPVGRLDMATTGLLLLTNDTRLSAWLTDPKNNIVRVYIVVVSGCVTEIELNRLRAGIVDRQELLKPFRVILRKSSARESHLTVELTEGKNREIRRMFQALGHDVTALKRVAFGALVLNDLPLGAYKAVSQEELRKAFPSAPFRIFK